MLPRTHEADKLQHHDQRARRSFRETEAIHHLARFEPTVMKERLLRDIRQHRVRAAKGDYGRLTKEQAFLK